jgi:hypothetical protein
MKLSENYPAFQPLEGNIYVAIFRRTGSFSGARLLMNGSLEAESSLAVGAGKPVVPVLPRAAAERKPKRRLRGCRRENVTYGLIE